MALSPALQKLVSGAANKYNRSGGKAIKPKEGVNRYRFLAPTQKDAPWVLPTGQFWADCGVHWIRESENGKVRAVVGCDSIVNNQPCAVCTAVDEAIKSAIDEESKKLYEGWRARATVLVNVLDRSKGSQNPDDVQILELTGPTWGKVMAIIQQYAEENEDILDPAAGMDITITRSGTGLNTEYAINVAPGKSAPVTAAQLKGSHDLFAHIQKEFFRGEEPKALAAIASVAGINLPRLAGPSHSTPTRALTSQAATVEDADEEEVVAAIEEEEEAAPAAPAKAAAAKPAPAPAVEEDDAELDDVLADLDNL